jgi:hypothetical protein
MEPYICHLSPCLGRVLWELGYGRFRPVEGDTRLATFAMYPAFMSRDFAEPSVKEVGSLGTTQAIGPAKRMQRGHLSSSCAAPRL